ncbi:hypothetical protein ACFSQP_00500 [Bizionia sediminis]|uniref:Cytochrome c n=1 Tax=Bizionia sediminis TaxID=1737064 RepID=A0ABW5KQX9_9FLAO
MKIMSSCFGLLLLVMSCQNAEQEQPAAIENSEKIVYDMYQPSEMANLMNAMYAHNETVKEAILAGEDIGQFPMDFLEIHTAELSEFKYRNETFQSFSQLFILAQKELYNPDAETSQVSRFNNVVNLCIACHQTECTGPISRIKKLHIK